MFFSGVYKSLTPLPKQEEVLLDSDIEWRNIQFHPKCIIC